MRLDFHASTRHRRLVVSLMQAPLVLLALGLLLSVGTLTAQGETPQAAAPEGPEAGQGDDWDYSRERGPERWAELNPSYVLARVGGSQSPVDIATPEVYRADLPELVLRYPPQPLHIINNGHTVEMISTESATLRFGDHVYTLRQLHFHAPSEHTIDGVASEVEIHFVHADGDGHMAVLAVLFEEGEAEHPEIGELLKHARLRASGGKLVDPGELLDLQRFLPDTPNPYYTYDGSLTTPPVTEGVRWFILQKPLHLTREQIEDIDRVYYSNNRPTQPRNARLVLMRR